MGKKGFNSKDLTFTLSTIPMDTIDLPEIEIIDAKENSDNRFSLCFNIG